MNFKKGVKRAEMANVVDLYVNGVAGQVGQVDSVSKTRAHLLQ